MDKQIKAFVSSTFEDLKEHRAYVIRALRDAGIHVDPMENWTADSNEPKQFSRERIKGCDLCVLLVAFRRGYIPEGETESITQMEYRYAIEQGIDVLPFVLDDDAPWPRRFDEMDRDTGVRKWREELRTKHGAPFFGHEPNSIRIEPAIARWLKDKSSSVVISTPTIESWTLDSLRDSARKAGDDYLDKMQRERVYLPHLYARRIELESHLSGFLNHNCTKNGMLIVGTSGIGKTNTLCHIVKQWCDDPEKIGQDIVWLVGGSTLPGGNFVFRDVLMDRLELPDSFSKFLATFESYRNKNIQLVIIVDGVDKHPQPCELLRQLDDLIVRSENLPWLKVIISIGEVAYGAIRKTGLVMAARDYYTVTMKDGASVRESTEVTLGRMTNEELAEAYGKYLLEPGFAPASPVESLTDEVKNSISNPLFLRIVVEVYNGRRIPRRVLTSEVLLEYCNKKVFSDPNREFFINRFVDYLYNNGLMAASIDTLAQMPDLHQTVLDSSPQSAYLQLLDEQVLEVQYKRVSSILPPHRSVAFTYDRLLEYLLIKRIVEQYGITADAINNLSERAVNYLPLRGVLTTLLLSKVEEGAFIETAKLLQTGNREVMRCVAIDLLTELEQMTPTNAATSQKELEDSQVGKLITALLSISDKWITSLLVEYGRRLSNLGLYRRAGFVYERLLLYTDEKAEPGIAADIRRGFAEVKSTFGQKREALKDYEQALFLYQTINDQSGEETTLDAIGRVYFDLGELITAKDFFKRSLEIDRILIIADPLSLACRGEAESIMNLSEVYYRIGEHGKAVEYAEEARKIYARIGDQRGLAAAMNRVGVLYRCRVLLEEARHYHKQALTIYEQLGDKKGTAQEHCCLGITYHVEGVWENAYSEYQQAIAIYQDIGNKDGLAYTYNVIGEAYRWEGKFEDALTAYKNALNIYREIEAKFYISMCLGNLGATYLFTDDFKKAMDYLEKAKSLESEVLGMEVPETLAFLSAAAWRLGDLEKALAFSDAAIGVLKKSKRFGEEDVPLVYYYRYKILDAMGRRADALESLRCAYNEVMQQAEAIKDTDIRQRFIQNFPLRRDVVKIWENESIHK